MTKKLLVYPLLIFAIVSCSNSKSSSSEPWPSESRENFLSSCEITAETNMTISAAGDYCQCALKNLERSMSIDEFIEAEQAMMAGEASNIDLEGIAAACT